MDFRCPKLHSRVERSTRTEYCLQHNCTRCVASVLRRSFIAQPRRRECGDSSVECCQLPSSSLLLPSNRSHVFLRALLPCTLVTWRRLPLRHALFPIALRSARGHRLRCPRFAAEGVFIQDSVSPARPGRRATPPLHSAPPTDRPTDLGRRRFFSLKYAPPCLLLSLVSRIVPPESQVLQETRASSPSSSSSGYSFFARALPWRPRWRRGCPPGWLPAAGLLVLVVISIGRRGGRDERRQCAATPISQSRRIDWAIEEEEERQRRPYLLEDEEAFEVFEVGDRY